MWRHLFGRIDIPKKNVNILNGNAPDLDAECSGYEERIRKAGGIRLFLGGIGPTATSPSTSPAPRWPPAPAWCD